MIALYIIDNSQLPNWSDALQAFIGIVGIPLTIFTLWKLVKKDKEREAEIASLSNIAEQLKNMMAHNEKLAFEAKKPQIFAEWSGEQDGDIRWLTITNVNPNSQMTGYDVPEQLYAGGLSKFLKTEGANQKFEVSLDFSVKLDELTPKEIRLEAPYINLIYIVDYNLKYSQRIDFYLGKNDKMPSPKTIILVED